MQTIIDGIFVGNFIGEAELASINISQPFMQIVIGICLVMSIGGLSFLGRSLGEGKTEEAQDIFKTIYIFLSITLLLISIIGITFSPKRATLLGANEELLLYAQTYIRIISFFPLIIGSMFLFGFTSRILGKPELYLKATLASIVVNVTLNYIFLAILKTGIGGAAFATGIAHTVSLYFVIKPVLDKNSQVNLFKGRFVTKYIVPVMYNGSSEGVTSVATATSTFIFNLAFMEIAGTSGVAAFTAISYLSLFGGFLIFGIADVIGSIISYNFGNEQHNRVIDIMKLSLLSSSIIGIILFAILSAFAQPLVEIFADNTDVVNLAVGGAKIYAFAFLLSGFNVITGGYFTAIGDAKSSIIISASRGLIFILIGITVLPIFLGVNGVWATVPCAELLTAIFAVYILKNKNQLVLSNKAINHPELS
ncbi:hypothetical protein AN644_05035 [Candidatus Epulonipiscium fishelsonii]|nr:hypothetical protein AN644_05035 [Epulopiscium sp. SCG-C06WGA-EpuloA1]